MVIRLAAHELSLSEAAAAERNKGAFQASASFAQGVVAPTGRPPPSGGGRRVLLP